MQTIPGQTIGRGWSHLEHFRFICCHFEIEKGGFFLRKKPLGFEVSVKGRIENAVAAVVYMKAPVNRILRQDLPRFICLSEGKPAHEYHSGVHVQCALLRAEAFAVMRRCGIVFSCALLFISSVCKDKHSCAQVPQGNSYGERSSGFIGRSYIFSKPRHRTAAVVFAAWPRTELGKWIHGCDECKNAAPRGLEAAVW
jgi:hypothetical protein